MGQKPPPPQVVIVGTDDTAYTETNTPKERTIPRAIVAEAMERIAEAKPVLLVSDFRLLLGTDNHSSYHKLALKAIEISGKIGGMGGLGSSSSGDFPKELTVPVKPRSVMVKLAFLDMRLHSARLP